MIVASLMAGVLWTLLSSGPNEVYLGHEAPYDKLFEQCEDKGGRACCRASVRAIRAAGTTPINLHDGCPTGQKAVSLRCPASMNWCVAMPRSNFAANHPNAGCSQDCMKKRINVFTDAMAGRR